MSLERVVSLANLLVTQRERADKLKSELAEAERALRRTEQEDLPELMREIGMMSVRLTDGSVIDVVEDVDCGISEERRAAAHAWLIEQGYGGLIKTEVVVRFGRGEHDAAMDCAEAIGGELQERVHPSTLKSFVKEQLAAGRTIPFEVFGVRPYSRAKLKKA